MSKCILSVWLSPPPCSFHNGKAWKEWSRWSYLSYCGTQRGLQWESEKCFQHDCTFIYNHRKSDCKIFLLNIVLHLYILSVTSGFPCLNYWQGALPSVFPSPSHLPHCQKMDCLFRLYICPLFHLWAHQYLSVPPIGLSLTSLVWPARLIPSTSSTMNTDPLKICLLTVFHYSNLCFSSVFFPYYFFLASLHLVNS